MYNIKNVMAREHVVDQLRAQGYDVTDHDSPIMVSLPGGTKIEIAVRSRWTGKGEAWWITDDEVESAREDLIYVFVDVTGDDVQRWVVPSLVVAKAVMAREEAWKAADPEHRHGTRDRKMIAANREEWKVPGYPAGWLDHYRDAYVTIDLVEHKRYLD